jgi:CubicO group peptidase (beta-lactamase class C family)
MAARQVSTALLLALFAGWFWLLHRRWPLSSASHFEHYDVGSSCRCYLRGASLDLRAEGAQAAIPVKAVGDDCYPSPTTSAAAHQARSSARARCTAGRSLMRARCASSRGSVEVSTPSASSQPAIACLVAAAVSMSADAFALKYLFVPLEARRAEWKYYDGKRGVDTGGHLRLDPDDFLKIGQVLLTRGMYKQTRIVSEAWIDAMTQERTSIPGMGQRYGYLWWLDHTKDPKLPQTRLWWAQGNGGSFLIVMPELKSVIAITATRFNKPDMLEPMFWLRDRLLPAMQPKPAE